MSFGANTAAKLKNVIYITVLGGVICPLFTCIAFGFDLERAVKGFIAGVLISALSAYLETYIFIGTSRQI